MKSPLGAATAAPGWHTSSEAIMKCELCKRDLNFSRTLCDTCADAIRRLLRLTNDPPEGEARRHKIAGVAA